MAIDGIDDIAVRLKLARKAWGMNQASWCRTIGIDQQAWNNYERGLRRISLDQAIKICQATGISLDWIYRGLTGGMAFNLAAKLQQQARQLERDQDQDPS